MGIGVRDRVIEKIILILKSNSRISKYVGDRVYGSHLSTIIDFKLPAISIHIISGGKRQYDGAFADEMNIQIDPWFSAVGSDANVWDDVIDCHSAIVDSLHQVPMFDDTIGIKIFDCYETSKGPCITDPQGVMHIPSRYFITAVKG